MVYSSEAVSTEVVPSFLQQLIICIQLTARSLIMLQISFP
jgi:hypothetical protein